MANKKLEIPHFVEMRGCINCPASENMRRIHGRDYGFDHEIVAYCILKECFKYGYGIYHPFFDPEEVMRVAKETDDAHIIEKAGEYCGVIKRRFGDAFEAIGVSLDGMLKELNR